MTVVPGQATAVGPRLADRSGKGARTGRFALCEQLLADGISYVFGNPGTVEQGFLDALANYPDLQYVCTLHETVALAIADGYARATHRPAVVQLLSGVGLGNGIGRDALYGVGEAVLDAVYQCWFDTTDALGADLESAEYQRALDDMQDLAEPRYIHRMAAVEDWIIGPETR